VKLLILSKMEASLYQSKDKYAVIGVVSNDYVHPNIPPGYIDRLQLNFYDIDFTVTGYPGIMCSSVTKADGRKIIDFVEKNKNNVDHFVVHCNAGISRSSGIAAALSKIYNGDDSWVFNNYRYVPNMLVYRTIIDAYNKNSYTDLLYH